MDAAVARIGEKHARDVVMGDILGMESYVEFSSEIDMCGGGASISNAISQRLARRREEKEKRKNKEYPPPLPGLFFTENVRKPRVAWVMRRYYTEDGRLIIRKEKGDSEYLCAHRSNGRLTMYLVPIPDDTTHDHESKQEKEHVQVVDHNVVKAASGGAGALKCYNCRKMISSSRFHAIPVSTT